MKGMVRCESLSLTGPGRYSIQAQERHGKREDGTSQRRKVRDVPPLVYGSLNLQQRYHDHIDGVKVNASLQRPALHFIIKMPHQILGEDAPGPFASIKDIDERKMLMMKQAVDFINETHGGNAVFAARVDRDEAGELNIDVFAAPVYEKITKTGKNSGLWLSPTKFGKDLAMKHQEEIRLRHVDAKEGVDLTGPRAVGIALQSEFSEFFERENGVKLERTPKDVFAPDRLETEAYKRIQAEREQLELEKAQLKADQLELIHASDRVHASTRKLVVAQQKIEERTASVAELEKAAENKAERLISKAQSEAQKIIAEADAIQSEANIEAMKIVFAAQKERDLVKSASSLMLGLIKRVGKVFGSDLGLNLSDMLSDLRKIDRALSSAEKSGPETDRPDF